MLQSPQLMTFYDLLDDEDDEDEEDGEGNDSASDGDGSDDGNDDGDVDGEAAGGQGMNLDASDVRPPRFAYARHFFCITCLRLMHHGSAGSANVSLDDSRMSMGD